MEERQNEIIVAITTEIVIGSIHLTRYALISNPFTFFNVTNRTGSPISVNTNATAYGVYAGKPRYSRKADITN
jgi:hypothetical protein